MLPFEPYYKLEMKLLEMAVAGEALPDDALLNVVLFPGSEPTVAKFGQAGSRCSRRIVRRSVPSWWRACQVIN